MGSCFSSVTAAAAKFAMDVPRQPTAKVVAADGSLTEYAAPISASDALGGAASAEFFLCDADRLCFGASVPALGPGDLLQRGQLYFVLPLALRGRALSGLDMAALAVKASAALDTAAAAAASSKKRGRRVMPVEDALVQHPCNGYDFYSTITVSASNSASNNYDKMMASKKKGSARTPECSFSAFEEDVEHHSGGCGDALHAHLCVYIVICPTPEGELHIERQRGIKRRATQNVRVIPFSAFWLRSSVVSVLISLMSDTQAMCLPRY
uniref:Uncharacterized protein n=1 Tax=Ananas comosus var. bracteatus TaxID=296719 RepID=A0A6V7PL65_ANACO|nr:unnamed protein product [Ananas comosus var. bracteatus]